MSERKKNRGGRPRLPAEIRRGKIIRVRFTPSEFDRIRDEADEVHLSISDLLRLRALDAHAPRIVPQINLAAYEQLRGAAHNLNQLARLANAGGFEQVIAIELPMLRGLFTGIVRSLLGQKVGKSPVV